MRNRVLAFCFPVTLAFVFLTCSYSTSTTDLRVALGGNPDSLDPHKTSATLSAQVTRSIYDTLVEPDRSPLLATEWKTSADGREWTFVLKKNVFFHNDSPFTSQDVKASIERIRNPNNSSPFREQFSVIKDIHIIDSHSIRIVLHQPYSGLLALLGDGHAAIMPHDLIASHHTFSEYPIGTGPFVFQKWTPNHSILLKRNDRYFRPLMAKTITFLIIADPAAQVQAMARKELDFTAYIIEPEKSHLRKMNHIKIVERKGSTVLVLALNMRRTPLSSLDFRRAIAQAVDKKRLLTDAYGGGKETSIFWPQDTPYSAHYSIPYDKEKSKRYSSTHPHSEPLILTAPTAYAPHVRAAQIYQQMFSEVGLETTIELVDWATWLSRVYRKGDFDMTIIGHTGKIHPDQRLTQYGKGHDYVGYRDEKFVQLVDTAREASDNASYDLYKKAFLQMSAAIPFVFVGETSITTAHRTNIKNIDVDPVLASFDFRNLTFE